MTKIRNYIIYRNFNLHNAILYEFKNTSLEQEWILHSKTKQSFYYRLYNKLIIKQFYRIIYIKKLKKSKWILKKKENSNKLILNKSAYYQKNNILGLATFILTKTNKLKPFKYTKIRGYTSHGELILDTVRKKFKIINLENYTRIKNTLKKFL
jgi:hypothetical protein